MGSEVILDLACFFGEGGEGVKRKWLLRSDGTDPLGAAVATNLERGLTDVGGVWDAR